MNTVQAVNKTASLDVDLQLAVSDVVEPNVPPNAELIEQWASQAYAKAAEVQGLPSHNEVTIRVVDESEITALNRDYREKNKPTNVLSFPFEVPDGVDMHLLGDIVICHDVIVMEAERDNKTINQHYAHMVTHGILHLCGYDHENDLEANQMESLETDILALSGLPDPYNQ